MDSSLSTIQINTSSARKAALAGETSRCSRCVRDKKGCDRQFPCSRCIESGIAHLCVYTGAVTPQNHKTVMTNPKYMGRNSLRNSISGDNTDEGYSSAISIPQPVRQKRRGRGGGGGSANKYRNLGRKRQLSQAEQIIDNDWFNSPPERVEEVVNQEPEKSEEELLRDKIFGEFTDIVTHLPIEIYRSTTFIRSLDQSYVEKTHVLDDLCRELQHSTDTETTLRLRAKINLLMTQSKQDRAEAIAEVAKLQRLVESHILLLNADIDKIENPTSKVSPVIKDDVIDTPRRGKKKRNTSLKKTESTTDGFDIPIDDDEPVYCTCQRVSFGKMIACENENCEGGEWFHFDCLGFTTAPKGRWWCDTCTAAGLAGRKAPKDDPATPSGRESHARESKKESLGRVRGETLAEKRARIREENRVREANRRLKLKSRKRRQ